MEKWQALKPAERRSLQEYSDEMSAVGGSDFELMMEEIQVHQRYLRQFLEGPRSARNPFIGLLGRLREALERATGKPVKITRPQKQEEQEVWEDLLDGEDPKDWEDPPEEESPFVTFVFAVNALVPDWAQRSGSTTISAQTQAVSKNLRKFTREGKLPSSR